MERYDDLAPDLRFLKFHLKELRLKEVRKQVSPREMVIERLEWELALLQYQTQSKLIETINRNSKSTDILSVVLFIATIVWGLIQIYFI